MRTAKDADLETYDMEWEEGVNDHVAGAQITDNPYELRPDLPTSHYLNRYYAAWKMGWEAAAKQNREDEADYKYEERP